jgi:hypothetical protein
METVNCTAQFDKGKLTIWGGFQNGLGARVQAAQRRFARGTSR